MKSSWSRTPCAIASCTSSRSSNPEGSLLLISQARMTRERPGSERSDAVTNAKISAIVGTRCPAKDSSNHAPQSRPCTCASVSSPTAPVPFVVRSTVESCMQINTPSAVRSTSNSKPTRKARQASNAASVFSGALSSRPRCPQIIGQRWPWLVALPADRAVLLYTPPPPLPPVLAAVVMHRTLGCETMAAAMWRSRIRARELSMFITSPGVFRRGCTLRAVPAQAEVLLMYR